jgi:hypothetical protein
VYFFSCALREAKTKYPSLEKSVLAIVHMARRLRHYFQAYKVNVLTNQPVKEILDKHENLGRPEEWAIELGDHGISYLPRTTINSQILADFLFEGPKEESKEEIEVLEVEKASNDNE